MTGQLNEIESRIWLGLTAHNCLDDLSELGATGKRLKNMVAELRDELAAVKKDHAALIDVMDKLETIIGQAVGLSGSGPLYDCELLVKELAKAKAELDNVKEDTADLIIERDQLKQRAERAEGCCDDLQKQLKECDLESRHQQSCLEDYAGKYKTELKLKEEYKQERDDLAAKVAELEQPQQQPGEVIIEEVMHMPKGIYASLHKLIGIQLEVFGDETTIPVHVTIRKAGE